MTDKLLSLKQAADYLNTSPATVLNWIKAGRATPFFKLSGTRWKVKASALEAWASKENE